MCAGWPRLESHSHRAGEEAGTWGAVEDHQLGLHFRSAGTYGAQQSQVSNTLSCNKNKLPLSVYNVRCNDEFLLYSPFTESKVTVDQIKPCLGN